MEHGSYLGTRSRTRPDTRKAMVGALKAGLIVMAVFADRIAPYSYDESVPGSRKKPPSVRFMGTDNIGRDMWRRAVYGARIYVKDGFYIAVLDSVFACSAIC